MQDVSTHPKVAAEPSMYWPRVRSMPLGPGPNLMMLVAPAQRVRGSFAEASGHVGGAPKMKPMMRPTAAAGPVSARSAEEKGGTELHTAAHHGAHLDCQRSVESGARRGRATHACRRSTGRTCRHRREQAWRRRDGADELARATVGEAGEAARRAAQGSGGGET